MRPRNNILVAIAALIVSVQTSPPNIGRGSFSYDPNSIVQNERILRLFLRLASYTANRLIYLKNEAKQREKSKVGANANNAPQLRIGLPQKVPEEKIANSGYYGQSGGFGYDYGRDPRTTTYGEPSRNRYDFNNKYSERVNGAYVSTTEHMLSNEYANEKNRSPFLVRRENDRVIPNNPKNIAKKPVDIENRLFIAEKNNYVTNNYDDNSRNTNNTDVRMKNIALPHQPGRASSVLQSDAVMANPNTGSLGLDGSKRESNDNRANTVGNQRPPNGPSNLPSLVKSGDQSGKRGPEIGRQMMMSTAPNVRSQINGAASAVQSQEATRAQSSNAGAIASRTVVAASNYQSAATEAKSSIAGASTARKTMTAASNHQSPSTEWSNTVQAVASNRQSSEGGMAREAMTAATNLQSAPRGVQNSIAGSSIAQKTITAASNPQLVPRGAQNSIGGPTVAKQTMTAATNLQFGPKGLSNTVEGVASNGQSSGGEMARETMTAASNPQLVPRGAQNSIGGATVVQQTMTAASNLQSVPRGAQNSIGGPTVVQQTMAAASNLQFRPTGLSNTVQGVASNSQSSGGGMAREAMTAATNLQSAPRGVQNSIAGSSISQKPMVAASHLQSGPMGLSKSMQGLQSNRQNGGGGFAQEAVTPVSNLKSAPGGAQNSIREATVAQQTMTAASNPQSVPRGAQNSNGGPTVVQQTMTGASNLQSVPRGAQNSIGGPTVAKQTMAAASHLQSGPTGLSKSIQSLQSNRQSGGGGIADLTVTIGSNMQSSPLEKLSSSQDAASKISTKTMTAVNENQATQRAADMSSGILNSDESKRIIPNAKPLSLMTKQGPSLANLSETISVIRNIGSGPSDSTTKVAKNGDKKFIQENQNPAMSVTRRSTGPASQVVGGLTGVGSKYTEQLVLKRGEETKKAPTGTRYRQGNSASAIMTSDGNGVTDVRSNLIDTVSLFRSFPDIKDQSRSLKTSETDVKKGVKDVPNGVVKNSGVDDLTIDDGYGKYEERGVSEVELQEYANQFANALRPIRAMS